MSRRTARAKYTTLRNFIAGVAEGKLTRSEVEKTLDDIELGIGLKKREIALAKFMEGAPDTYESDPVYVDGFNMGVAVGYEAAKKDVAAGLDILQPIDPIRQVAKTFGPFEETPKQ